MRPNLRNQMLMKKLTYLTAILVGVAFATTSLKAGDEKPGKNDGFIGVVTKTDPAAKSVTVKGLKEKTEKTFTYSETTKIVDDDGKEIEISTISEGVRVKVLPDESGSTAKRIKVTEKQVGEKKGE